METLGFLELNSIAKGVEATDKILKTANIKLLLAKAICPGKYNVMFRGSVSDAEAAMENGKKAAGSFVVDAVVIPRVRDEVISAINSVTTPDCVNAVGILEFFNITTAVKSADTAVKSADVTLVDVRLGSGIGGKSFVTITGDTASVETAVAKSTEEAKKYGVLIASVVISNPRKEVFESLL